MDDKNAMIVDISSDEDDGGRGSGHGGGNNLYWSNFLQEDKNDDVAIVGEVCLNKQRINSSKEVNNHDDDDDCVVLDGDPDKPVTVDNQETNDDSGELVIISEKGEVACRDFPHPRHLCAKFPFASTPHESHCYQCHCYVCDSRAPCVFWGSGNSKVDHCHGNEKEQFWKTQRKYINRNDKVTPVTSINQYYTKEPPLSIPSSVAQIPVFNQSIIRPCSAPTKFAASHGRNRPRILPQPQPQSQPPIQPRILPQPHPQPQPRMYPPPRVQPQPQPRILPHPPPRIQSQPQPRMYPPPRVQPQPQPQPQPRIQPQPQPRILFRSLPQSQTEVGHRVSVARIFEPQLVSHHLKHVNDHTITKVNSHNTKNIDPFKSRKVRMPRGATLHMLNQMSTQQHINDEYANLMPSNPQLSSQQHINGGSTNFASSHPQLSYQQHSTGAPLQEVRVLFANSVPPSQPLITSQPLPNDTILQKHVPSPPMETSYTPQPQSNFMSNNTQNIFQPIEQSEDFLFSDFGESDSCFFNYNSQPSLITEDSGLSDFLFDTLITEDQSVTGSLKDSMSTHFPEPTVLDKEFFYGL